jgi:hypothetical protein
VPPHPERGTFGKGRHHLNAKKGTYTRLPSGAATCTHDAQFEEAPIVTLEF